MMPQARRDQTMAALLAQLTGLAARQPVLVIYEDVHWIDPSSRELLDRVIAALERQPVLLLGTFRPEFKPPWIEQAYVTSLALTRLDRHDTTAMIAGIAGDNALPEKIAQEIGERTDGVPLFIEEVTKAVVESGPRATEALSSLPHPALVVPATLKASLIARLDRLGPAARDMAQKGAVIGREFRYELIVAIADRPERELRESLERLTSAGLLFARGTPPEATYLFKHALVQDAAYGTLLKSRRQDLHGMLAEGLEQRFPEIVDTQPELLAHHYTEAKQTEKAISLWQKAGSLALKRVALTEAITHLKNGMELVVSLPASAERDGVELNLRSLLGQSWIRLRGWPSPEVWDSLHPALALAHSLGCNNALLPIFEGLHSNVLASGRIAESLDWVKQIQESAQTYR